jgi:membrane-associated protein
MEFKTFFLFNVIGGALWISSVTYLGYFLGYYLQKLGVNIDTVLLPIIFAILLVSASPAIFQLIRNKKQRDAIWNATKQQIKKVFRIK